MPGDKPGCLFGAITRDLGITLFGQSNYTVQFRVPHWRGLVWFWFWIVLSLLWPWPSINCPVNDRRLNCGTEDRTPTRPLFLSLSLFNHVTKCSRVDVINWWLVIDQLFTKSMLWTFARDPSHLIRGQLALILFVTLNVDTMISIECPLLSDQSKRRRFNYIVTKLLSIMCKQKVKLTVNAALRVVN